MGKTKNSLRTARNRAGLSTEDVAVRIRVLPDRITRWEIGAENPDMESLYTLSMLYDTPPHRLLIEDGTPLENDIDPPKADESGMVPALDAFRRELNAMRAVDLLPLDDETIDYCVGKMRDRLVSEKQQQNK